MDRPIGKDGTTVQAKMFSYTLHPFLLRRKVQSHGVVHQVGDLLAVLPFHGGKLGYALAIFIIDILLRYMSASDKKEQRHADRKGQS